VSDAVTSGPGAVCYRWNGSDIGTLLRAQAAVKKNVTRQ
jgi:hypothetical protein